MSKSSAKKSSSIEDIKSQFEGTSPQTTPKRTEAVETETRESAQIKSNTFYKILFDGSTTAEEKKAVIEQALVFEGTKTENAERVAEFESFKQYLQFQRQAMAKEFMKLADTKSFAELKQVIDDMNKGLIKFDDTMKPLSEILDAVYTLRTGGPDLLNDAYRDIETDRKAEEERKQKLKEFKDEIDAIENNIREHKNQISDLNEEKSWFGLGGIKKSARQEINRRQLEIEELQDKSTEISDKLKEISERSIERSGLLPPEYADAKAKLRDLLDISSEEHSQRQKDLINAAREFVEHAQIRTGAVLGHLESMDKRMENIADANGALRTMYAIMNDASKDAVSSNKEKVEGMQTEKAQDGLSAIAAMELDDKIMSLNDHITNLDRTSVDTSKTLTDLAEQSGRILTMKDRNKSQVAKTRSQMTSGIGGVADRLVSVLTAVSLASLSESSELMQSSIQQMDSKTRESTKQEVFQKVLGQKLQNDELAQALEDASEFREMMGRGTELYRQQVTETHNLVDEMSKEAEALKEMVDEAKGAHAEALSDAEKSNMHKDKDGPSSGRDSSDSDGNLVDPFAKLNN